MTMRESNFHVDLYQRPEDLLSVVDRVAETTRVPALLRLMHRAVDLGMADRSRGQQAAAIVLDRLASESTIGEPIQKADAIGSFVAANLLGERQLIAARNLLDTLSSTFSDITKAYIYLDIALHSTEHDAPMVSLAEAFGLIAATIQTRWNPAPLGDLSSSHWLLRDYESELLQKAHQAAGSYGDVSLRRQVEAVAHTILTHPSLESIRQRMDPHVLGNAWMILSNSPTPEKEVDTVVEDTVSNWDRRRSMLDDRTIILHTYASEYWMARERPEQAIQTALAIPAPPPAVFCSFPIVSTFIATDSHRSYQALRNRIATHFELPFGDPDILDRIFAPVFRLYLGVTAFPRDEEDPERILRWREFEPALHEYQSLKPFLAAAVKHSPESPVGQKARAFIADVLEVLSRYRFKHSDAYDFLRILYWYRLA